MLPRQTVDISENDILEYDKELLEILLRDHTTGGNIIWATDSYCYSENGYGFADEITIEKITGMNGRVILPRVLKTEQEQKNRSRDNAEVFTPSWVCNSQNNLVDESWFGYKNVFNYEKENSWVRRRSPVKFPAQNGKDWIDYIQDVRMEITCGEAPYLTSRYDATTGEYIDPNNRIGLLDRKLIIAKQHSNGAADFHELAKEAYKNTYGFELQGDNILLARENLLFTYMDFHTTIKGDQPGKKKLREIADIISWNIWQMDGLKYGIPGYSPIEALSDSKELFEPDQVSTNLKYCRIRDWKAEQPNEIVTIPFITLVKAGKKR